MSKGRKCSLLYLQFSKTYDCYAWLISLKTVTFKLDSSNVLKFWCLFQIYKFSVFFSDIPTLHSIQVFETKKIYKFRIFEDVYIFRMYICFVNFVCMKMSEIHATFDIFAKPEWHIIFHTRSIC